MNSRRKRPVPFQPKRLVTPRTGVGGLLKIEGETAIPIVEKDSGKGPSILPSSRTEAATQYQEVLNPCINEEEEHHSPDPGLTVEGTPAPPQPTPERLFSTWAMSADGAPGQDLTLPHLTQGRAPQFAIQAPPIGGSNIRAATTPATKRLPGITEPTDGRPLSGRKTTLPPYFVKSSIDDVERLPAIHPSVWSSRGEKKVEYRGFITAPPMTSSPPTTAKRGNMLQLNTIPLKRPSAVQKKEEAAAPCWRCALHLDHSTCESTKYIRIGGGYRHSYWFVKQMIQRAKEQEKRRLALIRRGERKIFEEKLMWRVGADGKRERRIKTFVRTSSGRKIEKFQYVPEDVFDDMMKLREGGSDSAKRRLQERLAAAGISEDQIDTNWDPNDIGLEDVALDEDGNILLDEFGDPIDMEDTEKVQRAMERHRKERRVRRGSDAGSYADSGLAFDEKEERERRRRRDGEPSDESGSEIGERRRVKKKGGGYESESDEEVGGRRRGKKKGGAGDDWDSEESVGGTRRKKGGKKNIDGDSAYSGDSRTRRKKKGAKGKHGHSDDDDSVVGGGRRRRKGKKGHGSGDDFSDDDSHGGKKKGKKGKKKGGHGGDDSESDSDTGGGKKGKKKKKGKGKKGDSDSDDDSGDEHGGKRGKKKKGKKGGKGGYSDDDDSQEEGGGRRKKKGRRGRRDHSGSDSDYSGQDEGGKHGKHRKHRSRRRDSRSGSRSGSSDGGRGGGRRRKGGRRRRHRNSDSDSGSRSRSGSRTRRRRGKGHRRHHHDDDYSGSDSRSRSGSRSRRRKGKHRSRRRDGSDYGSGSDDESGDSRGGHRRRKGKKGRRHRHRSRGGSSGSEYSDEEGGDGRRKHRKHRSRRRRNRDGSDHSDYSSRTPSGSEYDDDERRRRRRKKKHRSRRRHSSDDDSDYSDRKSRRRRHRRRHSSDSRSYSESDGSDRSRSRRRRRRNRRRRSDDSGASSDESDRSRRRRRRHRRKHRSGSEASDYSSDSDRSRRRRRRRRRHRDDSEDSGSDSDRSRRHRRRRRHRRHSDSDDSDSGSDRSRSRRRRHRRRRSHSDDSSSGSRHRGRRHRRRRRRHSDSESDSYSDDSSYDSRSRRRKHRRHRKHSSDGSSGSDDSRRDRRRRKDKKDRRRRRYSTSTEESSAGDEKPSKRDRRRRKKYYSDSESDSDDSYRGQRKKKHRRPPRPPSTSSSDLSSEASSSALRGMTKEKRREYERRRREKIARKEKRQEMREEYERYTEKKERKKERRQRRERGEPASDSSSEWGDGKTAVKYGRGSRRAHDRKDSDDYRDIGYDDPNDPWTKKERRRGKKKEGRTRRGAGGSSDEGDSSESEYFIDDTGKMKKKEKKKRIGRDGAISSASEESIYEDVFNEDGTVSRKKIRIPKDKKKKQRVYDDDELDAESEYESIDSADADKRVARQIYDKDGEVIRLTRSGRRIKDGKISKEVFDLEKHKQKKDKKKKEKQLLERSYEEEYVEEFVDEEGQVIRVTKKRLKGQTAPGRRPTTPLTGPRRVQVLFLKGGKHLQNRLAHLLESCPLNVSGPGKRLRPASAGSDDYALDLDERDGRIDYLSHFQLVDPSKLEGYGKAFVVEDTDENNVLTLNETKVALEGIPSLQGLGPRQMHYILKILGIDDASAVTFKMFAVISALCERLLEVIDDQTKQWMEIDDLMDLERKLELYRQMFYWNICSERSPNYIKASSLRVELIAGGVNRRQEDEVMARIETNIYREVSFIDYMAFVPLFLCAHENIIENPLDDSRDKFQGDKEYVFIPEKDMVPLGRPMTRASALDMKSIPIPYIFEKRPGSSPRKRFKLALPRPPVEEIATPSSFATPVMSPVPPKPKRLNALKARMARL